jgi:hypothetical protein
MLTSWFPWDTFQQQASRLTLHADDSLSSVQLWRTLGLLQDLLYLWRNKGIQLITERVSKHGMNDQSFSPEESLDPDTLCPVDDLVGNDEMSRFDILS